MNASFPQSLSGIHFAPPRCPLEDCGHDGRGPWIEEQSVMLPSVRDFAVALDGALGNIDKPRHEPL